MDASRIWACMLMPISNFFQYSRISSLHRFHPADMDFLKDLDFSILWTWSLIALLTFCARLESFGIHFLYRKQIPPYAWTMDSFDSLYFNYLILLMAFTHEIGTSILLVKALRLWASGQMFQWIWCFVDRGLELSHLQFPLWAEFLRNFAESDNGWLTDDWSL